MKTIQIFLPGGDPQGVRVAEITTRIVQVIDVPRSLIKEFFAMPESQQVALYFLFGEADDAEPSVYIGQTGDLRSRLYSHNKEKDFWQKALIVISRTNNLTQTHALFLEWYCLQEARKVARYADENANSGSKPHTPAPMEADCLEVFDTTKTLLATMGYPVFEPLAVQIQDQQEQEIYYCTASESDGRGLYTQEGFVVLEGSSGRAENTSSMKQTDTQLRNKLIDQGISKIVGDRYVFLKNHLFKSPSRASGIMKGCSSNGWIDWKDRHGQTLDENERQSET